ncbi:MAG: sigma 54-interacting transcriptional regulator [Myxococcota bacterium]
MPPTLRQVQQERDFYLRILQLDEQEDVEGLLKEALSLILEITQARRGYIELSAPHQDTPSFSLSLRDQRGPTGDIREELSGSVIAEAMLTGETVEAMSAMEDPRFAGRESVEFNQIEAVLCVPIGAPPLGVIYLQGKAMRLGFDEDDRQRAERFARHLAPRADRLIHRRQTDEVDHTKEIRASLVGAEQIIGRGQGVAEVLLQVRQIAPLKITVLLSGPTGSGKSALARLIADNSPRARAPFVALNCANLPIDLVESELFGAARGAHSTATRAIPGKVQAAEGGTLFLDEIAELPHSAQAKLLQLLQERTYYPLGASQPQRADVRIIAASHRDLRDEVAAGRFREDLMYRLQVFVISIPGLDRRREDIAPLAEHFCRRAIQQHGLSEVSLSAAARAALLIADWPGHIRQLANTIESAVVRAATTGATRIEPRHLFFDRSRDEAASQDLTFQQATLRFQAQFLQQTLDDLNWNVSKAARKLDLARSHVYNLIKLHALKRQM